MDLVRLLPKNNRRTGEKLMIMVMRLYDKCLACLIYTRSPVIRITAHSDCRQPIILHVYRVP